MSGRSACVKEHTNKKAPEKPGLFCCKPGCGLDSSYVRSLESLRTPSYFERHSIAFSKGFESFTCDCGKMTKNIFTIFLLKKTETLAVIEPFYHSIYHLLAFS